MDMLRSFVCVIAAFLIASCSGCAGIDAPTPDQILRQPLGTDTVKVGMTKQQIRSIWGEPNEINQIEKGERWKGPREEWVYRAQFNAIPIDADYLSKSRRLYFDGDYLTDISEKK